jgi:hypothetical protein
MNAVSEEDFSAKCIKDAFVFVSSTERCCFSSFSSVYRNSALFSCSVTDMQRFDANPVLDLTFCFDADSDRGSRSCPTFLPVENLDRYGILKCSGKNLIWSKLFALHVFSVLVTAVHYKIDDETNITCISF